MKYFVKLFLLFISIVIFTSCSDKSSDVIIYKEKINISGVVVDNYIKDATVCIDTNKNNDCSDEQSSHKTTTDKDGKFSFANIVKDKDMVVIAYVGKDIKTNEDFTYIVKNIVENTDENNILVLSSLNTLITDYKLDSNKSLEDSKSDIADFFGGSDDDISSDAIISDVIANQNTNEKEFLRSLKLFQMIDFLNKEANATNNNVQSAISFKALSQAILNNNYKHNDSELIVNREQKNINVASLLVSPVFMDIPIVDVKSGIKKILDLNFVVDPNENEITYSLNNINDNSIFKIIKIENNYILEFISTPTFNNNQSNTYIVSLTASNGISNISKNISINIVENPDLNIVNEIVTNGFSIIENNVAVGSIEVKNTNSSVLTYSILGEDASSFIINSSTGKITLKNNPDFELKSTYNFTIKVSDTNNNSNVKQISLVVNNENDAPTLLTNSFDVLLNTKDVGILDVKNSDNDILTYSLSGNDANHFALNSSTGKIEFLNIPNYDVQSLYSIIVTVSDDSSHSISKEINIILINDSESLKIITSSINIKENTTDVGVIEVRDSADKTLSFNVSGADASYFDIDESTGLLTLKNVADFEIKQIYNILITVNDNANNNAIKNISISISNENDAATILTNNFTISENTTEVGIVQIANSDLDSVTYLLDGTDASSFTINPNTGELTLKNSANFETKDSYSIIVKVTDGEHESSKTITIGITNVNDAPTFTSANTVSINENETAIVTVSASDEDNDTLEYTTTNPNFTIDASTGVLVYNTAPNFEDGNNQQSLIVTVNDGSVDVNQTITVSINNLNDNAPVFTSSNTINVDENNISVVTLAASDEDNSTLTYTINDTTNFNLNSNTNVITFVNAPDYETNTSYTIIATVNDGSVDVNQTITVSINNLNDNAPNSLTLTENYILNGNSIGYVVGDLNSSDDDANTTFTYTVSGEGNFSIVNTNQLQFNEVSDYNTKNEYNISIEVSDDLNTYSKNFTISIKEVTENGSFLTTQSNVNINQNDTYEYDARAVIDGFELSYNSSDSIIPFGVVTVTGTDTDELNISILGTPDDSLVGVQTFKLVVDTNKSTTIIQEFNITVIDVNDAPTYIGDTNTTVLSLGSSTNLSFTINDGDSNQAQDINLTVSSSNSNVNVSINNGVNDTGIATVSLEGINDGESNITVILVDNGNSGLTEDNDTTSFNFLVKVRANGWKIYENQKNSNFTISSVLFDDINYTWNNANLWYETNNTILIPAIISNVLSEGANFNTDKEEGHNDINKSNMISHIRMPEGSEHNISLEFTTISSDINITAKNDNFNYDPVHKLFVSRVILNDTNNGYEEHPYIYWTGKDINMTNAPEELTAYSTDVNLSNSYADGTDEVDINNDGNISSNICAKKYGQGWRLPTAFEMGINIDHTADYKGYIPAYAGDDDALLLSSQVDSSGQHYTFKTKYGNTKTYAASTDLNVRCIYSLNY